MRHERAVSGSAIKGRCALALAVGLACLLLAPAMASASSSITAVPVFPANVAVGDTGASAEIVLTNSNTAPDASTTFCNFNDAIPSCAGAAGITLIPSCTTLDFTGCSAAGADPGVFTINPVATGTATSACPGRAFTVTSVGDAFGTVRITPATGNLVLATPGSSCHIALSFSVNKLPADAQAATGLQTRQRVTASAVSDTDTPAGTTGAGSVTVKLAAPSLTDTDPDSPANDNVPKIKGSAAAGTTTVTLYATANCSGASVASGTAATFASPGFGVGVANDTTTTFSATVTDSAGGVSACSTDTISYVEDSTPPAAPTVSGSDPASPSNVNTPRIKGSAATGSTVRLYTNATCTSAVAGTGTTAQFATPGLLVTVLDNTTTTFYATATDAAGNTSPCSAAGQAYVEDSTPPAAPSVTTVSPASPANNNAPQISGTAVAGTTVTLYTNPTCTGASAGSGTSAAFAAQGISASVADDTTTTFYATATDPAGNASACSATSVTYVEDSTDPANPAISGTSPASPANNNAPRVTGSAPAGTTVALYTNANCTSVVAGQGPAATFASPGIAVVLPDDTTTTLYARTVDAAGNFSACVGSVTYVEDSSAPDTAIVSGPADGATSPATFTFSSSEAGGTFECRIDGGAFVACTSPFTTPALSPGSHTFEVRSRDAAGNTDGTSATRQFTVAAAVTPPPAPLPPPPPGPAPPPSPPVKPAQTGCLGITGTLYIGTAAANVRNGSAKTDIMFGQAGKDRLSGAGGLDCLYAGAGNDVLRGGSGPDRLFGDTGNDRVEGLSGNDRLSGQSGSDRINGGSGNDSSYGGAGRDTILDRRGKDRLSGGSGNDRIDARDSTLSGRRGSDRILCGAGVDTVLADPRDNVARDCERSRVTRRSLKTVAAR